MIQSVLQEQSINGNDANPLIALRSISYLKSSKNMARMIGLSHERDVGSSDCFGACRIKRRGINNRVRR